MSEEVIFQSTENRKFIEDRLLEAKQELSASEKVLVNFQKQNLMTENDPDLQLQFARHLRNIEVNQEVYISLRQQYELSKIEELKDRPVINKLDEGFPAPFMYSPNRVLIIFLSFSLSIFLSIYIVYIRFKLE